MASNSKVAYIFPGQGSQFQGMGRELYESNPVARELFEKANHILGFSITEIMFNGTAEDLKQTMVTQPAVFIHSAILAKTLENFKPDMVAGHSLGEFSALVAAGVLDFEDGLRLVAVRANAMQRACEATVGAMAAIMMLSPERIEEICSQIDGVVVAANYNYDGQTVISGEKSAVELACERLKAAGAKRAMMLPVGGAFHSPLMQSAAEALATGIEQTVFNTPLCPVYQNVTGTASTDPEEIKRNLLSQLTSPVRWTQTVTNMINDGANHFIEVGPGKVLQGLVSKIATQATTIEGIQ